MSLAVGLCGVGATLLTQPKEAALDIAKIVFVVLTPIALIYFAVDQWRKRQ